MIISHELTLTDIRTKNIAHTPKIIRYEKNVNGIDFFTKSVIIIYLRFLY